MKCQSLGNDVPLRAVRLNAPPRTLVSRTARTVAPLLLLSLLGCVTTSSEAPPATAAPSPPLTRFIRFEPQVRPPVGSRDESVPVGGTVVQFFIPGALFGRGSAPEWAFDLGHGPFQLEIGTFVEPANKAARTLSFVSWGNGLRVIPAETRIARMGVMAVTWQGKTVEAGTHLKALSHTGVNDPGFFLVYFDRPCRMYGSYYSSGGRIQIDVTIEAAGFSWLRFVNDARTGERRIVSGDALNEVALTVYER